MTGLCHSPHATPVIRMACHAPRGIRAGWSQPRQPISSPAAKTLLMTAPRGICTSCSTSRRCRGGRGVPAGTAAASCARNPDSPARSRSIQPKAAERNTAATTIAIGTTSAMPRYRSHRPSGPSGQMPRKARRCFRGARSARTTTTVATVGVNIITGRRNGAAGAASPAGSIHSGSATSQARPNERARKTATGTTRTRGLMQRLRGRRLRRARRARAGPGGDRRPSMHRRR